MYTWYNCALEWRMTAGRCASRRQVPGRTTWGSPQPATRTRTGDPTRTATTPRTMTKTTTMRRKMGSTNTSVSHTTSTGSRITGRSRKYFSFLVGNFVRQDCCLERSALEIKINMGMPIARENLKRVLNFMQLEVLHF